jgi:hypothetical protein
MTRQEAIDAYWMEFLEWVKEDTKARKLMQAKDRDTLGVDYLMFDIADYERIGALEESFWRWYMREKME